MAVIETKYSVGDVVFHAHTTTETKQHPCPDCLGTRKWSAVSPAGTEYEFGCPRCSTNFLSDADLSLRYTAHVGLVSRLTIGSVQHNSAVDSWDSGNRYMCRETGVGSGSVYPEDRLFTSEADAAVVADALATEANTKSDWIAKGYNKTLAISDYQLSDAKIKAADDAKSRVSRMFWNVGYLFDNIKEAEDKDGIIELIDDYKSYDWVRDGERFREEFGAKSEAA